MKILKKNIGKAYLSNVLVVLAIFITFISSAQRNGDGKSDTTRPNIIFIMSDDHAYQAISAFDDKLIKTPNIDRIAAEGAKFNNSFVTNSICAPSRAVMLTGKYSHLNGKKDNLDVFDGSQQTFIKLLKADGYETSIFGKWHLKSVPEGFDIWNILIDQGEYYNPNLIKNGDTVQIKGYTTDLITEMSLEYLDTRNENQPFVMLLHNKAPHRNWMPKLEDLDEVLSKTYPLPETFYDDYSGRSTAAKEQDMRIENMFLSMDMKLMPGDYEEDTGTGGNRFANGEHNLLADLSRMDKEQYETWEKHYAPIRRKFREDSLTGDSLLRWKYQRYMQDYLGTIKAVDDNVGRLLDYLDKNGLSENTLVVYTSDQGFYLGEHGWYDKRFMYEESLRMPLMMRYPKAIKAGTQINEMVLNLDFAPTFLDFAQVQVPSDMQGQSFKSLVLGESVKDWRTSLYYHYYEFPEGWHSVKRHYGVRTDRYKLIHFYNDIDAWELYDLREDPNEMKNLIGISKHGRLLSKMKNELNRLQEQYNETVK
ncbi:sulfatase family protein [Zobellia alginiliquefaciens]|uniref:sulfatase family protein n=1 Tax=Zobellia alginiliquefaciens TaxID=3032586 RepID=UPI0023E389F5|nr:sulfatase [Zobellia alginiliquefaciens]